MYSFSSSRSLNFQGLEIEEFIWNLTNEATWRLFDLCFLGSGILQNSFIAGDSFGCVLKEEEEDDEHSAFAMVPDCPKIESLKFIEENGSRDFF